MGILPSEGVDAYKAFLINSGIPVEDHDATIIAVVEALPEQARELGLVIGSPDKSAEVFAGEVLS